MKNANLPKTLFFALLLVFSFSVAKAQENPPVEDTNQVKQPKARPNLLQELGLSADQMQAIRRLNEDKKTQLQEAQQKAGEARRNLDLAIYSDNVNDNEVKLRLEEFQKAQMEVIKIRSTVEYEIRKILTPDQVVRFRELRRRFDEIRENFQNRRKNMRQNQNEVPQNRPGNRRKPNQ